MTSTPAPLTAPLTAPPISPPLGIVSGCPEGPGAYIACLASYNEGTLYGYWADLKVADDPDMIQACIDWVIATSPTSGAKEYAIHDWAGVPRCMKCSEWPDWEEVFSTLAAIEKHGDAFSVWHEDSPSYDVDTREFEAAYRGCYESGGDFAREYYEERQGEALEALSDLTFAIDWEAVWERSEISQLYWGSLVVYTGGTSQSNKFYVFACS